MKTCQNCEFNKELCGERDCHFTGQKTVKNGVCSGWEADLETYKKAWEIANNELSPMIQCGMDYAMSKAIEGS